MELYQAHNQWSHRPADERFNSLQSLYTATKHYADIAVESPVVQYKTLRVEAVGKDVMLVGKGNKPAGMTNWAFGQLSSKLNSPASFLRTLPPTLACQIINHKLRANETALAQRDASILFQSNGRLLVRSITSEIYSRVWNWEVAERLLELEAQGWAPARPTFRHRANDAPALYASDHDMFAFVMMPNVTINQPVQSQDGKSNPLYKGLIYWNSEVGASSLCAMSFWFNAICGNHIIWGASDVVELKARHTGTICDRIQSWGLQIKRYANASVEADQTAVNQAAEMRIAGTKEQLLDALFGKKLGVSRKVIEASYDAVLPEHDGDPRTVWGWVAGATRYSQTVKYADERTAIDRAAAKVMRMRF